MEAYDIVMIVVLVAATVYGAIKGFAWQLASIASILVSYFVAHRFREPFSQSISVDPPWNRFLAMLILFVVTSLLIWVAFRMVSNSIDRLKLREFDRHIGAVFGLIKGCLYCILLTLFAVTLAGNTVREKVVQSKSGNYIADVLDRSEAVIPPEIHEVIHPYLEKFDQQFNRGGGGTIGDSAVQVATDLIHPPAQQPASSQWSPDQFLSSPPSPFGTPATDEFGEELRRQAGGFVEQLGR